MNRLNIIFLANRDLASSYALSMLLPALERHKLRIFLSDRVGTKPLPGALKELSEFEGSLYGKTLALPDQPAVTLSSFDRLGQLVGDPIESLNDIDSHESVSMLRGLEPDLFISIRYGKILKGESLDVPKHGILNLHSGVLPQRPGIMATFWAMLFDDPNIGTTLHYIENSGIDSGRIIEQSIRVVDTKRSYLWNVLNLYPEGVRMICRAVALIAAGQSVPTTRKAGERDYRSYPDDAHLAAFFEKGLQLYDSEELVEFVTVRSVV